MNIYYSPITIQGVLSLKSNLSNRSLTLKSNSKSNVQCVFHVFRTWKHGLDDGQE
jgi:hypothetical protein